MAIQIREQPPGRDLDAFLSVPELLYRGDPGFVMPLDMVQRALLTPAKNPYFQHAEATLFRAYRDGKLVGRISAQIDRQHLAIHRDHCGSFGFFDTVDDPAVGRALVDAAATWLKVRGLARMRGPFSISINDEIGTMVEGQAEPSMFLTPYHRPYQDAIATSAGLAKAKDVLSWRYDVGEIPVRARKAHEEILKMPEVRIRTVQKSQAKADIRTVVEIFNDAWSDNYNFVPLTEAELTQVVEDFWLLIDEKLGVIAEVDGKPVGVAFAFPNLNEATHDLRGRLFPLGLPKLLYRLKVKGPKSALLRILGIRKEYRTKKRYGGLSAALYVELAKSGASAGYEWGELGWTDEDNHPINLGIRMMGGRVYKRHRIYEKSLT